MPILKTIFGLQCYERLDNNNALLLEISHYLLQRLCFNEPLRVEFKTPYSHPYHHSASSFFFYMMINNVKFYTLDSYLSNRSLRLRAIYLCSLIPVKLQIHFISTSIEIDDKFKQSATEKELSYVHAINCVWRNYHQQSRVKSLLRLCILCTRSSMSSLDDASFMSLPVPPLIRKLLTYRDIAEEIFEEWCHGPTTPS